MCAFKAGSTATTSLCSGCVPARGWDHALCCPLRTRPNLSLICRLTGKSSANSAGKNSSALRLMAPPAEGKAHNSLSQSPASQPTAYIHTARSAQLPAFRANACNACCWSGLAAGRGCQRFQLLPPLPSPLLAATMMQQRRNDSRQHLSTLPPSSLPGSVPAGAMLGQPPVACNASTHNHTRTAVALTSASQLNDVQLGDHLAVLQRLLGKADHRAGRITARKLRE